MLLDDRRRPSVSVRTSSKQCWMCWLQATFVFWQRVKMSSAVVGSSSEFSHHQLHPATYVSLRVRGTSTSCWTNGSRSTGTTGWKVFEFSKFNSENSHWKSKYLNSPLLFVYMKEANLMKFLTFIWSFPGVFHAGINLLTALCEKGVHLGSSDPAHMVMNLDTVQ